MNPPARIPLTVLLCAASLWPTLCPAATLDEIVVTSERRGVTAATVAASLAAIDAERIAAIAAQHPQELLARIPGVWWSRGSGQESLPAIRSPVLSGAGACGAFLTLEDGIPTRPAGFCNVNQLFELDTEQAAAVEVQRGPGSALYGANALHGTINVLMPEPGDTGRVAVEAGPHDYYRARLALPLSTASSSYGSLLYAHDGGFRADTGYRQWKAYGTHAVDLDRGSLRFAFTATDLDQQTGGYILGEAAYKDPDLRLSNPNPEAFRDAASQRAYAIWTRRIGTLELDVRPYLRHSDMTFLQHFLPGQPLEENGQTSGGFLALLHHRGERVSLSGGLDLDLGHTWLVETQDQPTTGSDFLVATRPVGKHYDFTVDTANIAAYAQAQWRLAAQWTLTGGIRLESTTYDYDNRMLTGNTRDDGEPCGFGGCLYTRPADRRDRFTDLAPNIALTWSPDASLTAYLRFAHGFRPPQTTELYRLQNGQSLADLDSETLDSAEFGLHHRRANWQVDIAAYAMRKRNSILRDADGYNVSGGRSRHTGLELDLDADLAARLRLSLAASYARHVYDFDRVAAQGETFSSGRDVDTAPRWLASADLAYTPFDALELALQWSAIGAYFLDAENQHEYPGHNLWNARATLAVDSAWAVSIRLNNLADARYADRADFAFGNYRYFPGRSRELVVELAYSPGRD